MDIKVNPYSNYSKPNAVNFQAKLDYSRLKSIGIGKAWHLTNWENIAKHFEKLTADSPDDTFVLTTLAPDDFGFHFWNEYKNSRSSSIGYIDIFWRDEFVSYKDKKKAETLVKLYRIKKTYDEMKIFEDDFLRERTNGCFPMSFIGGGKLELD